MDQNQSYSENGRIIKITGGLYTVRLEPGGCPLSGQTVECRARGGLRHQRTTPLVGDMAAVTYTDASFRRGDSGTVPCPDRTGLLITDILPRKNSLIRPPLSNLDSMLVVAAAAAPDPDLYTLDKLLAILEHNRIQPVLVVSKADLDPARAGELATLYTAVGYPCFVLSCLDGTGMEEFSAYARRTLPGGITAVAGASGAGKSTLLNTVFPGLSLVTGDISRRIQRGKNTTRHTELFPLPDGEGYIADTAGFSLLDFEHFDFFDLCDLADTFREFAPYLGHCRYTDCTHQKEEGCAVVEAVRTGQIAPSRHRSYRELYAILKEKHKWESK